MVIASIRQVIANRFASRFIVSALSVTVLFAGFASVARPAAAAGDCTVSSTQIALDGEESALLAAINAHRAANGRAALQADATLNKAAAWASQDDARRGIAPSNHVDTLGRGIATRFADCGYPVSGASIKENNFYGTGSAINPQSGFPYNSRQDAMHFWSVRSPDHNAALLDAQMRFAGVARECSGSSCYFTLTLGSVAGPTVNNPPPPPPASTSLSWPIVRQGAQGERVETLQRLLVHHGQNISVDGDFGPQTYGAVRAFQQARGLTADGIVGPNTWSALIVTVRRGSQGNAVRALQDELAYRGYAISVDGDFGPQTEGFVRQYQQARGLAVDGIVGRNTWNALINGR